MSFNVDGAVSVLSDLAVPLAALGGAGLLVFVQIKMWPMLRAALDAGGGGGGMSEAEEDGIMMDQGFCGECYSRPCQCNS